MPVVAGPVQAASRPERAMRVLVIDDDEFFRNVVARQLTDLGVSLVITATGDDSTVRLLSEGEPFHLVITDLAMPTFDGLQLTRVIAKAQPGTAVVYMSAAGSKLLAAAKDVATGLGLKVLGSLEKPVSRGALRSILENSRSDA